VTIAPATATALIDYLSSALKNNDQSQIPSKKHNKRHVRFVEDEHNHRHKQGLTTTRQRLPSKPAKTNRSRPAMDGARHRYRYEGSENSDEDVELRMKNLRVYNYFDQFAADKSGRAVMRLTRENAFLFE